jgi:PAS domain S-box-containing protein
MKKKRATETTEGHSVIAGDEQTQQERYRVFIEDVADGFYETDLRGNFKYFNDALCRIFGNDRSEIQDRNFRDFMDEDNAAAAFKRFNGIYRTGEGITDIIWEIISKDGAKRTIELSAHLIIDKKGKKNGFRGIAREVTREKRAARITAALFRIAKALYQFRGLDERLDLITKEVRDLMTAEGALVILIDEEKKEFLFRAAASDDVEAEEKYKVTRFPLGCTAAGSR